MSTFAQQDVPWHQRKRFWDIVSLLKYRTNKARPIPFPSPSANTRKIEAVPLSLVCSSIPIDNILVADHVPDDENSTLTGLFFKLQLGLYSILPPLQADAGLIDADPQLALKNAYTKEHRQCFDPPQLPDEYDGADKPDLGFLAVAGPYAGYLQEVKGQNGFYQWDLLELDNYKHHDGLSSLGVRVLFEATDSGLQAIEIESRALAGKIKPDDGEQWTLAKKIALCAVSTHTSLVRHFNWVHLASGGPFAIATRNHLQGHPLQRLLWPHIYGTQFSNQNVTLGQMVPGGKFDTIFSFTHSSMCQLFSDTYDKYSISVIDPELDAQERGLDGIPAGQQLSLQNHKELFSIIHAHTSRYIKHCYRDGKTPENDPAIIDWLNELEQLIPNGIGKLISADNVDQQKLARFCAGLIYLVTVQHEALGTSLWDYQLWVDKQPVRIYENGQRERVDVYQRLLNANFDLNVKRTRLLDYDWTTLVPAEKVTERQLFKQFNDELTHLQQQYNDDAKNSWKIHPNVLEMNMNASVNHPSDMTEEDKSVLFRLVYEMVKDFDWHELKILPGLVSLKGLREQMRKYNLYDNADPLTRKKPPYRSYDGSQNHWGCPHMGAAGTAFGRNFAPEHVYPDHSRLMVPNPREISRRLLNRGSSFKPVETLNLLAAAWIQFQVHDWFVHKMRPVGDPNRIEIPTVDGDDWDKAPMKIRRTFARTPDDGSPPVYTNDNSHWWDSSQIYGSDELTASKLRTFQDGKLKLDENGLLPFDNNEKDGQQKALTGFTDNWWIGLSMLHALFAAEHNEICDALKNYSPEYASRGDEWLYQTARLINSALMAKIHTLEWTTAILDHPTVKVGMQANWTGADPKDLKDELEQFVTLIQKQYGLNIPESTLPQLLQIISVSGLLKGIVGSHPDHHGVPYSLTEEFVSVYRMHPLLPDEIKLFSDFKTDKEGETLDLLKVCLKNTRPVMERFALPDLFYSFGTAHPGALRLHNYPNPLRQLETADNGVIDLAAVDILRDRERGVPRYNQFRQLLGKKPVETFEELTGVKPDEDKDSAEKRENADLLRQVYEGNINDVDLMIGLFAEPLADGLGISETAFRVFLLMASRRIQSDRFFTSDFNEEIYTAPGLRWVRDNTMITVLKRHYPDLEESLKGIDNAFAPWNKQTSVAK